LVADCPEQRLIVDRVAKPASTEELVILYHKAVFDRTVVKVVEGVVAAVRVRTRRRRIAPLSGSEILLQKLLNLRFVAGTTDR